MLRVLLGLMTLASAFSTPAIAQWENPIGIVRHAQLTTTDLSHRASRGTQMDSSWRAQGFQTWIVVGALIGSGTAAIVAAAHSARSDDNMMGDAALAYVAGAGAVIGALVGGFAYSISHSGRGADVR